MKHLKTIAAVLAALTLAAIGQPELTNTEATNIDTETERNAWKAALLANGEVKNASFTAVNQGAYVVVANATVTDPTTPAEGQGFIVFVRNGTATVGGTAYATAGTIVTRTYHSGAWANYASTPDNAKAITGGTATGMTTLATSGLSLSGATISGNTIVDGNLAIDSGHSITFNGHLATTFDGDIWNGELTADDEWLFFRGLSLENADTTINRIGAGLIGVEGVQIPTISSTDTLTNKTLTSPTINGGTANSLASASVTGDLTVDTTTFKVDSANNRVGIGTASPGYPLEIVGSVSAMASVIQNGSYYGTKDTSNNRHALIGAAVDNKIYVGSGNAGLGNTLFYSNAGLDMTLTSTGLQMASGNSLSFASNTGTWNGATIAGDQTLSGQIEMTGQAAATDNSAMTRGLVDDWGMAKIAQQFPISLASPNTATSGTGALVNADVGRVRVTSGTSTSGYSRATFLYTPHGLANGAYYNRAMKASINICFNVTTAAATDSGFRFWFGNQTPTAFDANALSATGFGVEYAPDGTNHRIRAFTHNGTTYSTGSWVNFDNGNVLIDGHRALTIESDGSGNITATITDPFGDSSTVYTSTTTGGPSSYSGSAASLNIAAVNNSTGTPASMLIEMRGGVVRFE